MYVCIYVCTCMYAAYLEMLITCIWDSREQFLSEGELLRIYKLTRQEHLQYGNDHCGYSTCLK